MIYLGKIGYYTRLPLATVSTGVVYSPYCRIQIFVLTIKRFLISTHFLRFFLIQQIDSRQRGPNQLVRSSFSYGT